MMCLQPVNIGRCPYLLTAFILLMGTLHLGYSVTVQQPCTFLNGDGSQSPQSKTIMIITVQWESCGNIDPFSKQQTSFDQAQISNPYRYVCSYNKNQTRIESRYYTWLDFPQEKKMEFFSLSLTNAHANTHVHAHTHAYRIFIATTLFRPRLLIKLSCLSFRNPQALLIEFSCLNFRNLQALCPLCAFLDRLKHFRKSAASTAQDAVSFPYTTCPNAFLSRNRKQARTTSKPPTRVESSRTDSSF